MRYAVGLILFFVALCILVPIGVFLEAIAGIVLLCVGISTIVTTLLRR